MTNIRDLHRYVERYPEDHEQRWRLVKKLYLACEYPSALQHLLILKNHWPAKLNLIRYLAATYYRLGRYDEAIEELQAARENWPHVLALCEQLARVYEVSGRRQHACAIWETILAEDPKHPSARQAIQRLQMPARTSSDDDLSVQDNHSGVVPNKSIICAECGAENSEELVTCWQCGVPLHTTNRHLQSGAESVEGSANRLDRQLPGKMLTWAAAATLVLGSVALTLAVLNSDAAQPREGGVPLTVYGLWVEETWLTRLVLAGVLAVAWPAALYVTAVVLGLPLRVGQALIPAGISLGAFTYISLWLPLNLIGLAPLGVGLASLLVCLGLFRASIAAAILGWLVQQGLVLLAGAGVLLGLEGGEPFRQFGAIAAHSVQHDHAVTPGRFRADVTQTPVDLALAWETTGSPWLDTRAQTAVIEIALQGERPEQVSAKVWRGHVAVEELSLRTDESHYISLDVVPGDRYQLEVSGEGTPVAVTAYGVLPLRFIY